MTEPYQSLINLVGITTFSLGFIAMLVWTAVWKGVALWKAARNGSKPWFIALLIVNTVGILEIVYIFFFSKKKDQ